MKRREVTEGMIHAAQTTLEDKGVNVDWTFVSEALCAAMTKDSDKIEVTEEMVARAWTANPYKDVTLIHMRAILEAALNPPPQVVVTREMSLAGEKMRNTGESTDNIYQTMRALEPMPYKTVVRDDRGFVHMRAGDSEKFAPTNGHRHRHSTD